MKSSVGYFRLGLFVLGGVALLVAGVVVLGVGSLFTETVRVETVTFESVEGLDIGAPVKFRGVPIGKVSDVSVGFVGVGGGDLAKRLAAGNQIIVGLAIDKELFATTDPVRVRENFKKMTEAGVRTRITSSGFAGPSYVEIVFLDPKRYPPPEIAYTPKDPYLPSAPGELSKMAKDLSAIAEGINRADLQKVIGHVDELLVSANQTVQAMRVEELRQRMEGILEGVDKAVNGQDVQAVLADLPKISDQVHSAVLRIDEILRSPEIQQVLDNAGDATVSANASLVELRRTLRSLDEVFSNQQQDLAQIVSSLRRVLENAAELTEDAKRNPSRVIFGKPPPPVNLGEGQ